MNSSVELDNRIFAMQQREGLTKEVSELVFKADVAYLQDREDEAWFYIRQAEALAECCITKE